MIKKKAIITTTAILFTCALVFNEKITNYLDNFFPLSNVQVEAPFIYVKKQTIEEQLTPYMKKGLLHINQNAIKQKLSALPWVKDITIKRVYPDTLFINIHEYQATAIFNEDFLLDENGLSFPITQNVQILLPKLKGNAGSEKELLQDFKKVSKLLKVTSLTVDALAKTASVMSITTTDDLKIIVNVKDAEEKLKRFVKVYPELLHKKSEPLAQVDLRYKHGLAVKWKPLNTMDS